MTNPTYSTYHPFNPLRLLAAWDPSREEIHPAAKKWVKTASGQAALAAFFDAYAEAERIYIRGRATNRGDLDRLSRSIRGKARRAFEAAVRKVSQNMMPELHGIAPKTPEEQADRFFRRAKAGLRSVLNVEYFMKSPARCQGRVPITYV